MDYGIDQNNTTYIPKECCIKYDLKDKRKSFRLLLIWPVSLLLYISLGVLLDKVSSDGYIYVLCSAMVMAIYIAPFVSLAGLSGFVKSCGYLSRLKAHGYMLPYDKKEYNCLLMNLPQDPAVRAPLISRECERFTIVYAVMSVLSFLFSVVYFLINNGCLGNARYTLFSIWNVLTLLLVFHSIRCHTERDNRIYRDDVEFDPSRRPRHHAV